MKFLVLVISGFLLTGCPFGGGSGGGDAGSPASAVPAKKECKPVKLVEKDKDNKDNKDNKEIDEDCIEPVETTQVEETEKPSDSEVVSEASETAPSSEVVSIATPAPTPTPVVVSASSEGSTTTIVVSNADQSILDQIISAVTEAVDTTPKYALVALSAESHSFSGTLNSESEFSLTISNTGDGAASSVSIPELTAPYRIITHNCGSSIAASGSCSVNIGYRPTANGDHSASLAIAYNDGQENKSKTLSLSSSASPSITSISPSSSVASQSLTLTGSNFTSQTTVTVGSNACEKTSVTATQIVCTIPSGSGTQVVSTIDNQKQSQYSSFTYGTPANITVSASSHDFGNVRKNNTATAASITITNNGGFLASNISLSGLETPFTASSGCSQLAPSASCTITINYAPVTVRSDADTLSIDYNNGSANASATVSLDGECIPRVVQVEAGNGYSCILYSEGNIKCVGYNKRLGNGTSDDLNITSWANATEVYGINNATQISLSERGACARLSDGTVKCWSNYLAYNDATFYTTPQTISGISNAVDVQVAYDHTIIRTADGYLKSFGENVDGRLGDSTVGDRTSPVSVNSIPDTYQIVDHTVGNAHSCAVTTTGSVLCWGDGDYQITTIPNATDYLVPTLVPNASNAVSIAAGRNTSCILDSSGLIKCWGDNTYGKLSNGEVGVGSSSHVPNQILDISYQPMSDFISVEVGREHVCAIKTGGAVYCWGNNEFGQTGIGNNNSQYQHLAKQAVNLTGVVQISLGAYHTLALKNNGDVYVWGANSNSQLGLGDSTLRSSPTNINIE